MCGGALFGLACFQVDASGTTTELYPLAAKTYSDTGAVSMAKKGSGNPGESRHAPTHRNRRQPVDLGRALVEAFLTNERINQVLLDLLSTEVWRAPLE